MKFTTVGLCVLFIFLQEVRGEVPQYADIAQLKVALSHHYQFEPFSEVELNRYKAAIGQVIYAQSTHLVAGQQEISVFLVNKKIKDKLSQYCQQDLCQKNFDQGRSVYKESEAFVGYLLKNQIVIVDGNHRIVSGLSVGSETIPIELQADLSHLPIVEAISLLATQGLVFPWNANGQLIKEGQPYDRLDDHLMRYLVNELRLKVEVEWENQQPRVVSYKGAAHPLFMRLKGQESQTENTLALALNLSGFVVANDISTWDLESLAKETSLVIDKLSLKHPVQEKVSDVILWPYGLEVNKKNIQKIIKAHFPNNACDHVLSSSVFTDSVLQFDFSM